MVKSLLRASAVLDSSAARSPPSPVPDATAAYTALRGACAGGLREVIQRATLVRGGRATQKHLDPLPVNFALGHGVV